MIYPVNKFISSGRQKIDRQKIITKKYFNKIAKDWFDRAYDPEEKFLTFPTGKVRQNITISEIRRLDVGKKIIDLGCGAGQLVINLLRDGYNVIGIDNAYKMIAEARRSLTREFPEADALKTFLIKDIINLRTDDKFDVVTAMGLLEYLEDDLRFFEMTRSLLKGKGFAFIECRNKLFNITSANQYTLEAAASGDLDKLILELDHLKRYSPTLIEEIAKILPNIYKKIGELLEKKSDEEILTATKIPRPETFPAKLVRRQHTPETLAETVKRAGLKLKYVIYYHCHPYLARYEKLFPKLYNQIALLMQPLGYTQLGGTICSAFVAVIEKEG